MCSVELSMKKVITLGLGACADLSLLATIRHIVNHLMSRLIYMSVCYLYIQSDTSKASPQ